MKRLTPLFVFLVALVCAVAFFEAARNSHSLALQLVAAIVGLTGPLLAVRLSSNQMREAFLASGRYVERLEQIEARTLALHLAGNPFLAFEWTSPDTVRVPKHLNPTFRHIIESQAAADSAGDRTANGPSEPPQIDNGRRFG